MRKYKPKEDQQALSCAICGNDTFETLDGMPLCFDCIERMQSGENDDIKRRVARSAFATMTIEHIVEVVQDYTGIEDICIKTRKREYVEARQLAMYFAKNCTKNTLAEIGTVVGGKDSTTVIPSIRKVKVFKKDKTFMKKYKGLFVSFE